MQSFSGLLAGGAVLGIIAACWNQLKAFSWRILSMLIQKVEVPSGSYLLVHHLLKNYSKSAVYDRVITIDDYQVRGKRSVNYVAYETMCMNTMLFWIGRYPMLVTMGKMDDNTLRGSNLSHALWPRTIYFVRGTVDINRIMKETTETINNMIDVCEKIEDTIKNRFTIEYIPPVPDDADAVVSLRSNTRQVGIKWNQLESYQIHSHDRNDIGSPVIGGGKALDNLIFPKRVKELIKEVRIWKDSRDFYNERFMTWKMGWLLYGPPGTGKTALARAFGEDLDMPVYVFNLQEISNQTLRKFWKKLQQATPCIALFEDFDNVFHGRENVVNNFPTMMTPLADIKKDIKDKPQDQLPSESGILSFDTILNCLDGVDKIEGVFTIITVNNINMVDDAIGRPSTTDDFMSSRPGRVDKVIELTYMTSEDKRELAARILKGFDDELEFVEKYIQRDVQETPSQFAERCSQLARRAFAKQRERSKHHKNGHHKIAEKHQELVKV